MAAATTSAEQVCNLALGRVGCTDTIDDIEEDTPEARACKTYFAAARDALLEMHDWRFARRRAVLALLADSNGDPLEFSGWGYAYGLPDDCLRPRSIYPGTANPAPDARIPFDTELADDTNGDPTVPVLLTDQAEAELFYTARIETPTLWSPLFVQALSWLLAIDLCSALPKKLEWTERVKAGFREAYAAAGSRNAQAAQPHVKPESEYITGRG